MTPLDIRGPEYESMEFKRSPCYADFAAALASVGCQTYRQMLDQSRAVRDRFHAEWTARMQARVGIRVTDGPSAAQRALDEHAGHRERIRDLHAEGYTDRMLAETLHISRSHAANLRAELGLAPQGPQARNRALVPKIQALVAEARGAITSRAIGEALGVSDSTVAHLRRLYPLGVVGWGRTTPRLAAKRHEALRLHTEDGCAFREIADRLGVTPSTAFRWVRLARAYAHTPRQAA